MITTIKVSMEGCKNQSKKREQHFLLVCLFGEKIEPSLIATKQLPFFNKHGRDCHFWLTTITILTVLGKRETTRNHVGNNAEKTVPMRRTSATFRELFATFGKTTTTIKIGFYFFTYECCLRQFPLIKMVNGVEKVLILLFTAFGYEYLF